MKKALKNFIRIITVFAVFMFVLSNDFRIFSNEFKTIAESYRTTYTLYGDLNNDKKIDSFDIVMMRQKVLSKDSDKKLDFNYDGKVDGSDLTLLSDYVLGKVSILDIYFYDDADADGLCDLVEISLLKTNPDSSDTDGDTLSDFEEIVYTKTSPTDKYTNKLSITDANDDSDGDKLTNKEELSYKTNPLLNDSDFDGINDYDEVKKYMTDPNNDDSDNDNIIDGDEIKLGLKPDTDKSNGTVPDNQRTFKQNIEKSSEILSYINSDDNPYELSIDIVSAGVAEKELSVSFGEFSNCSENKKIIGKSVALGYNDKLSVDSAKIYFAPRKIEGKISDYMIFEFFPENNYLLPVETKYTGSAAYVETTELGTYCLVNVNNIMETDNENSRLYSNDIQPLSSETISFSKDIVSDYELGETEVVFLVDISGALDSNLEETKNSIHDFSQALFEHTGNGAVEIYGYYANPTTAQTKVTSYVDSNNNAILSSMKSVDEALNGISSYTTNKNNPLISPISLVETLSNNNLFSSTCPNKYAFIISDSTYSFTNSSGFSLVVPKTTCTSLKNIYNNDIHLNFILSEDSFKQTKAINNLKKECKPYDFGVYSKSKTGYFANDMYAKIYSNAVIDLTEIPVVYASSVMPYSILERVERNAFINSLPKSVDSSKVPSADADGNIDFNDAVDKTGITFETLRSACDMFDLTRKGYEQLMANQKMSVNLIMGSIQVTPFSDKVLYADNDNDGIPNKDDPYPDEPFDDRFKIVDSYFYHPIINFMLYSKLGTGNTEFSPQYGTPGKDGRELCYNTKEPTNLDDKNMIIAYIASYYADSFLFTRFAGVVAGKGFVKMYNSAEFLKYFFIGYGKERNLSSSEFKEIISTSKDNLFHYMYNINSIIAVSEEVLKDGETIILANTTEDNFKVACYTNKHCELLHYFDFENETAKSTNLAKDWSYAIGEAFGGMVFEVSKNGKKYTMKYRYCLMDYYEWGYHVDGGDEDMHMLHECGYAHEYPIYGELTNTLEWEEGYRIKTPSETIKLVKNSK